MTHSGKVALVTGAGSGLGRATALAFAAAGAHVLAVDIDGASAAATAALITRAGGSAASHPADVSIEAAAAGAVAECLRAFGRLDFAFNNAGVGAPHAPVAESEQSALEAALRVNVLGVWACMKHELRHMREAGAGVIVNTASAIALRPKPSMSLYGASKAAVVHLTRTAAAENADHGIRVNAVCPGPVMTPMLEKLPAQRLGEIAAGVPMGRLGRDSDVSAAVLWLCSDQAAYITGATLPVDGGETA
jgi:NAD(P)-dependent dehydrogenase (short-subunit alcohol dehydrogenase family)